MPARENVTTSAQITATAREVDFVTRFGDNWEALRNILGIMRTIRKTPGTKLVAYKASVDGTLNGGKTVAEGDEIPLTRMKVEPVAYGDIEVQKYAKSVTIESVAKYGAEVAVEKTDDAFLNALQSKVLTEFYEFLNTGTLTGCRLDLTGDRARVAAAVAFGENPVADDAATDRQVLYREGTNKIGRAHV